MFYYMYVCAVRVPKILNPMSIEGRTLHHLIQPFVVYFKWW